MNLPYFGELLAVASALSWAIGVILYRLAGRNVPPLALNLFKNTLSLLLLALTLLLRGEPVVSNVPSRDLLLLLGSGVLGLGISDTFMLAALNRLGAGLNAVLWTFYAPMVILLSWLFLREELTLLQWLGVAGVLVALLLVARTGNGGGEGEGRGLTLGVIFALFAMATQALSVVAIKPVLERTPVIFATELRLLGGLLFLVPAIAMRPDRGRLWRSLLKGSNLRVLVPGTFFGTYLALTLMLGGVKYTLASVAMVLNQTSNLFIFLLAVALLREESGWRRWVGLVLGLAGAVLVTAGG